MIDEIRNYHFNPELFEAYKAWARTRAIPYLSSKMQVLGFWANTAEPSEVNGAPLDGLGSANITWIIRWRDMDHRNAGLSAALQSPEWAEIFSHVPGGRGSYLRTESKFAETLA